MQAEGLVSGLLFSFLPRNWFKVLIRIPDTQKQYLYGVRHAFLSDSIINEVCGMFSRTAIFAR